MFTCYLCLVKTVNCEVDMREILNNEFASIKYDRESNSIITLWKKPSTSEAYHVIFTLILDQVLELKTKGLISDIFQQGIVGTENRLWFQNEILPKAYKGGLKKIATISPNDVFSRFYIESVKQATISNSIDLEFQYFKDLNSAQSWVMNEEVPV